MAEALSFGRYQVTGPLGSGAMGDVYAAVDGVLGREVAIKTLRGKATGLAAHLLDERFRREARAIAALTHPSIVQVFDIDLDADPPYLVMERVAGPSLKEAGAMSAGEVRALGIQIARALAAAHASGIIHRDVKPANILVAGAGVWKLADFGIAHVPDSSLTMSGQFMGTPAYASPEALLRGVSSTAGDVFGLGATLYQALAGRWPRLDSTTGALLAPVPPLRELAPAVAADLAAAIDRAVAFEPADRPSAEELARLLAADPVAAVRPPARPRWRPWAIGGGVLAALVIVASVSARPSSPTAALPAAIPPEAPPPARPTELDARPPAGMDGKQTKDWNKIFEEASRGHYEGARHKLEEFERKYGQTDETRALGPQLDALGPDVHPEPHGKHKGRRED